MFIVKKVKDELRWFWKEDSLGWEPDKRPIDRVKEVLKILSFSLIIAAIAVFLAFWIL